MTTDGAWGFQRKGKTQACSQSAVKVSHQSSKNAKCSESLMQLPSFTAFPEQTLRYRSEQKSQREGQTLKECERENTGSTTIGFSREESI